MWVIHIFPDRAELKAKNHEIYKFQLRGFLPRIYFFSGVRPLRAQADPTVMKPRVRKLEYGKAGPIQLGRERERETWNLEEGRERYGRCCIPRGFWEECLFKLKLRIDIYV
jgi:hypothetical protein